MNTVDSNGFWSVRTSSIAMTDGGGAKKNEPDKYSERIAQEAIDDTLKNSNIKGIVVSYQVYKTGCAYPMNDSVRNAGSEAANLTMALVCGFGSYGAAKGLAVFGLATHPVATALICGVGSLLVTNAYSRYVNHTTTELPDGEYQNYRIIVNCRLAPSPQYVYVGGNQQEYLYSYEWEIAVRINEDARKWWDTVSYTEGPVYVFSGG